ncbi:replicative DNA helicase [Streptomyces sp. WMMC1477]|uniref:replicative DNA helicase n=1 Tax=Streptomyces sp. WMMC1477 TaxID=3015155 RepID=UPI0022B7280D|nr:DnaB-like helicase C-terminal domain-containing protein [Streptomyces sp. WMMC1477]MCZ7430133.1 AAA family ATPase [Streptomyces sp. WMMC1477]
MPVWSAVLEYRPMDEVPEQSVPRLAEETVTGVVELNDALEDALDVVELASNKRGPGLLGLSTGFPSLDKLTYGLQPGTLTVIASRPAMGRTTLLSDFCRHIAIRERVPTGLFSLEESRENLAMRILAAESHVALTDMRAGTASDDAWNRLAKAMVRMNDAPLFLAAPGTMTASQLAADARQLHARRGVRLLAVDGLQDIAPPQRNDLREREVGDVVRDLKRLALALKVPIVATCHLNRGPEQRVDRRPALDDLRESGAITFAADTIVLLHREDAYDKESPRVGEADLIVAKNRFGPEATVIAGFEGTYGRFNDLRLDPVFLPAPAADPELPEHAP